MQRESLDRLPLASALAKAQGELVNPEKSLVATIRRDGPKGTEQPFRYASLSSGLVHRAQSTGPARDCHCADDLHRPGAADYQSHHGSGARIGRMDRPGPAGLCHQRDRYPHRMGAALTYARRHALFTLVGIAGEDDLQSIGGRLRKVAAGI